MLSRKYLEALNDDADSIRGDIAQLLEDAQSMQAEGELRRLKSHPLSRQISNTLARSEQYEKDIQSQADNIRKLSMILLRIKSRMTHCPALDRFKEARRRCGSIDVTGIALNMSLSNRWDLVRSNLSRISRMKEKSASERIHSVAPTSLQSTPKYDPRRKTIYEEIFDLDEAQQGLNLMNDLQTVRYLLFSPPILYLLLLALVSVLLLSLVSLFTRFTRSFLSLCSSSFPLFLTQASQQVELQSLRLLTIAQRLKFIPQSNSSLTSRVDKNAQRFRGGLRAGVKAMLRSPQHLATRRGSSGDRKLPEAIGPERLTQSLRACDDLRDAPSGV
eukprot:756307-Hanusia_phi.AAC.1